MNNNRTNQATDKTLAKSLAICVLVALLMEGLAACGETARATPTVILSLPTSSATAEPTNSPSPEPSPTAIAWPVLNIPSVMETPTALATPATGAVDYRLKIWNEQAALGLVEKAEHFAYDDNVLFPFNDSRFNYQADQLPISLAVQEALHRFPNSQLKEKLEWRIVLADSIIGKQGTDEWILKQLEDGLNNNIYTLEKLNETLEPYAFGVDISDPVFNLFGDHHQAWVIRVYWRDTGSDSANSTGLYAGLQKDVAEHYRLFKIYNTWAFTHDYDSSFFMEDHTGDSLPEVIISHGYYNGSFCGDNTLMFQWQNDHFIDISQSQLSVSSCSPTPGTWAYGSKDAKGAQTIETRKPIGYYSSTIQVNTYHWNGAQYELAESYVEPPEQINRDTADWPVYSMGIGDYKTLTENIPSFLSSANRLDTENLGASYPDYLRFQLGLAYILQGKKVQGLKAIQEIANKPQNPLATAVPRAAQAYIESSKAGVDAYASCQVALMVMSDAAREHFHKTEPADIEYIKSSWGYYIDPYGNTGSLCNLQPFFYQLVNKLDGLQFGQAPDELRKAGVSLRSAEQVDLDGDGVAEWVLLVNTTGDEAPVEIWILAKADQKILALPIVDWSRREYDLPQYPESATGLAVKTTVSPNGKIISFTSLGEYLYIFQFNNTSETTLSLTNNLSNVQDYTIQQNGNNLEINVTHTQSYCSDGCKDILKWSNKKLALVYDWQETDDSAMIAAETALLSRWQFDEAIPLLQNVLENPEVYNPPYFMYLLGLAFELKGNQNAAVATYWDLWQKYPDSAYARLAVAKLKPAK